MHMLPKQRQPVVHQPHGAAAGPQQAPCPACQHLKGGGSQGLGWGEAGGAPDWVKVAATLHPPPGVGSSCGKLVGSSAASFGSMQSLKLSRQCEFTANVGGVTPMLAAVFVTNFPPTIP
jgi:hypothetical protein